MGTNGDQKWRGFGSSEEAEDLSSLSASGWRWEDIVLHRRIPSPVYAENSLSQSPI